MIVEFIKFIFYSMLIVLISKYILVTTLRKLAESLNLNPNTIGEISGYATSMPELLTVAIASFNGLVSTSIVNVLSSNIINLIQYIFAILLNKNQKELKNKAIKINLILVFITILIPIIVINLKFDMNIFIVPSFIITYFIFKFINKKTHNKYLKNEDIKLKEEVNEKILEDEKLMKNKKSKTLMYIIFLILTGILLFIVGDFLGEVLENLCNIFNISQFVIGILLGIITSVPELITFFEAQKHYRDKEEKQLLGVIEATNNLLTSNILNLFIIQTIGVLIYYILV